MKIFILILTTIVSFSSLAAVNANRLASESYEDALDRNVSSDSSRMTLNWGNSAERVKKSLDKIDLQEIPDVGSYADLEREFQYIRDTRFVTGFSQNFPRRFTWLFPDDGCYARAQLAAMKLSAHNFPAPKKVFVFGRLQAATKNSASGYVSWWYHVAVSYRVGGQAYILDPAIEPARPLKLEEWNQAVGGSRVYVQYSICAMNTFDPTFDCSNPRPMSENEALQEQSEFFDKEWNRILNLNRNPHEELGDNPPWLKRQ